MLNEGEEGKQSSYEERLQQLAAVTGLHKDQVLAQRLSMIRNFYPSVGYFLKSLSICHGRLVTILIPRLICIALIHLPSQVQKWLQFHASDATSPQNGDKLEPSPVVTADTTPQRPHISPLYRDSAKSNEMLLDLTRIRLKGRFGPREIGTKGRFGRREIGRSLVWGTEEIWYF